MVHRAGVRKCASEVQNENRILLTFYPFSGPKKNYFLFFTCICEIIVVILRTEFL